MTFQNRKNLAQEIADLVSERIIRMEIEPGERILEARIAQELNVSHSPVREAMRILERYRLVELSPRRGARVTDMSERHVGWMFDIMINLLGLIAKLCSENRTPEELDQLTALEEEAAAAAARGDSLEYFNILYEFALTAIKATGNPLLDQMIQDWIPGLRRAYFLSLSHSTHDLIEDSLNSVRETKQHIIDGSGEAASKSMQAYFGREKQRVIGIIRQHVAPYREDTSARHASGLR